jgi:DNA-binding FrmR family transcriptional regulator
MEHHLHTCVAAEIKKGNAKEVITEVMEIIKKK